jgi:DNA-binding transcriptional LysR family regulator
MKMLSVTLRQLEYVTAIGRHHSVSSAAVALNVSQPALSVALHQVETIIGKPLFLRRSGSPMIPTSFGRDFLEGAAKVVEDASRLIQGVGSASSDPVVVGFYEGLAPLLLAPVLSHLSATLPDIAVRTCLGSLENISYGVGHSGQIDCAITYDLGFDNAFSRSEIARLPVQAVVSVDHLFACTGKATMAQVACEPIILTNEGLSKAHMLRLFNERGYSITIAHEASTMETMRSLAANGLGVGLSYTNPKANMTYDGKGVRQVPIIDAASTEPVIIVSYRDNALSMNAQAVRGAILKMSFEL